METKEVLQYVLEHNGITYDVRIGNKITYSEGYYVSLSRKFGKVIKLNKFCITDINKYIAHRADFLNSPDHFLGIWINQNTSIVYLDISIHIKELEPALNFAKINRQLAIWDCANKTEVKV